MRVFLRGACVALALVLAGCKSASEQVAEGEQLSSGGKYEQALDVYRAVLQRQDLNANEKERALRGRGEAYLAKNDLVNAEAAFKGLPTQSSARSTLLGHVAYLRRDTPSAEKLYRDAYARGERSLVTTRLAEVVGGEAQTPARLAEASKILKGGGGDAAVAAALDEAAAVWAASEQGTGTASALLARLDRAKTAAPTYVSFELIRANLLTRSGQPDKATLVYVAIASFEPKPSEGFLQFIREQQMSAAVSTGDTSRINQMADAGMMPLEQAAKVRADIAQGLEASGSFVEALEQWRKTAAAGGAPAARAWCEVARLETIRGRSAEATEAWQKAAASPDPDGTTRALVAVAQARGADPLGATKALDAVSGDPAVDQETRDTAARLLRASERLRLALEEAAGGASPRAVSLARSTLALAPDLSLAVSIGTALALLEKNDAKGCAAALDGASATGETKDALSDARVGRLLQAGLFDDALEAAKKDPGGAAIARRAPPVLARLVAGGKADEAIGFLEKLKAANLGEPASELLGRVRGDAVFAALWGWKRFQDAAGAPDPLARRAPYCCELTLANGTAFGTVKVVSADSSGLLVRVPGRGPAVHVAPSQLVPGSLRGLPDEAFEKAEKTARELGERRAAPSEGGE